MKKSIPASIICEIAIIAYVFFLISFFYYHNFYGFFPPPSAFLNDYYTSIDFPNFWDTKQIAFYSILPFNTLLCILFKTLNNYNMLIPLIILFSVYLYGIFTFLNTTNENIVSKILLFTILLFTIPVNLGVYNGNIAVLFGIITFFWARFLVNSNNLRLCLSTLAMICIKFNFAALCVVPLLYETKNIFSLRCFRQVFLYGLSFLLIQIICFYTIKYYYPDYSLDKIYLSFVDYKKVYIAGASGFDLRCWLGSMYSILVNKYALASSTAYLFIAVSYLYILLIAIILGLYNSSIIRCFLFILLTLYLNLSTSIYWYTILLPFYLYFITKPNKYLLEILLMTVLVFPKPVYGSEYFTYENLISYITIIFYFSLKSILFLSKSNKRFPGFKI